MFVARHRLDGGLLGPSGVRVEYVPSAQARGVLVVVDYAERWPQQDLLALFENPVMAQGPVRVLLLARSGQFWPSLAEPLTQAGAVVSVQRLAPLPDPDTSREEVFAAASRAFAGELGVPMGSLAPVSLSGEAFSLMLAVHMAALVGVLAVRDGLKPDNRDQLVADPAAASRFLLSREVRHWQRMQSAEPDPVRIDTKTMARAVMVATLTRGLDRGQARDILTTLGLGIDAQLVIDDHRRCYPPTQSGTVLEPLAPDRLGEDFLACVLNPGSDVPGESPTPDLGALEDAETSRSILQSLLGMTETVHNEDAESVQVPHRLVRTVTTVLIETARHWDHIASEYLIPVLSSRPELAVSAGGTALARLCGVSGIDAATPAIGALLDQVMGAGTHLDLDSGAFLIAGRLVDLARSGGDSAGLANALNTLGVRLVNAGQRDEALEPAGEAVTIYRRLAEANSAAYLPDLAMSLHNYARTLAEVGQRDAALKPSGEAVTIYRRLAEANPAAYLPDLAMSLLNYAVRLAEVGQRDAALEPSGEAVTIRRGLAEANPAAYLPALAASLNNYANTLAEVGQRDAALEPSGEAVTIRRGLAEANPAAYLPALAMSLAARAMVLRSHDGATAVASMEEAVGIWSQLAQALPDAFVPWLVRGLTDLVDLLEDVGRVDDAAQIRAMLNGEGRDT